MDEEKIPKLEEDEELSALRLAALATLKQRSAQSNEELPVRKNSLSLCKGNSSDNDSSASNHIPFIQTDRSAHSSGHGWRKNNQSVRRRLGIFPKSSQRSNLIVISPVSSNENKDFDRESAPTLSLPQHKWYVSGHEDSMSPKSFRRTGPTRFNRHESDSEDSDSDFGNSDDSCSNETILQDEPSEKFSNSGREAKSYDKIDKQYISERRLSFPTLESNKHDMFRDSDSTSVYNSLKSTYSSHENKDNKSSLDFKNPTSHSDSELNRKSPENAKGISSTFVDIKSSTIKSYPFENIDDTNISKTKKYLVSNNDHDQKYLPNYKSATINNVWDCKDSFQDNLYMKNQIYNSSTDTKKFNEVETKNKSSSNNLIRELKKYHEYSSKKFSAEVDNSVLVESWASVKDADEDVKHFQNRQKRWHDSNSNKKSLTAEHLKKEYCKNTNFNHLEQNKGFQNNDYNSVTERDFCHIDKESNFGDCRSRENSRSPEYWKKYGQNIRESDERNIESIIPEQNYELGSNTAVNRQEQSQNMDFDRKKQKPNDNGQQFCNQVSKYRQYNNQSSENLHQVLSPKRNRRKSSSSSSENNSYKSNGSSKSYETKIKDNFGYVKKDFNQREDKSSEDSDSTSSTERSWRKHDRNSDRKRRERSWSTEAYKKEYEPSQKNLHLISNERWNNQTSSNVLMNSDVNPRKLENKLESLLDMRDKSRKTQMCDDDYKNTNDNFRSENFFPHRRHLNSNNDIKHELDRKSQSKYKDRAKSSDKYRSRSNSPYSKPLDGKQPYNRNYIRYQNTSSSRSRSSSCSSTSSTDSSSSRVAVKSVSSVIKSVQPKSVKVESKCDIKYLNKKLESDSSHSIKKVNHPEEPFASEKNSANNESRNHAESTKRVSVHMRLGTFPRKRVIQMTKDVEAAFVNTSSDDEIDVNTKCKKQNFRIVTKMYDSKPEDNGSRFLNDRYIKGADAYRERSRNVKAPR